MQSDFTVATGPRRTHPTTVILGFASAGLAVLFSLATAGASLLGFAFGIFGLREIAQWWFRTYELRADELVVNEGIVTRRQRLVPYHRVQQIDIHRDVMAQVLGLSELRIETAGSSEGLVRLRLLDRQTADAVRTHILTRRAQTAGDTTASSVAPEHRGEPWIAPGAPGSVPASTATTLLAVPTGRLVLAGVTGPAVVAVLCLAALALVGGIPVAFALGDSPGPLALVVVVASALGVAIIGGLSAFGTMLQYAGLTLSSRGDDLHVDYGLLEKQHLTVPRRRVQHISIADNPLRRLFGIVDVTLHSAATPGREHASHLTLVAFPRADLGPFLAYVMQDPGWHVPQLHRRNGDAHRRAIVRRTSVLCLPALVIAIAFFPLGVVSLVIAAALGVAWGQVAHRRAGYALTDTITVFAAGALFHQMHVVPRGRVQSARTTSTPFQRRVDLATAHLDVAGSPSPDLYDIDQVVADEFRTAVPRSR